MIPTQPLGSSASFLPGDDAAFVAWGEQLAVFCLEELYPTAIQAFGHQPFSFTNLGFEKKGALRVIGSQHASPGEGVGMIEQVEVVQHREGNVDKPEDAGVDCTV